MTTTERETEFVWKCQECEHYDSDVGPALYECSSCGEVFNRDNSADGNHKCPSCGKFGAKRAPESCVECEQGEVEQVEAYYCEECDEWTESAESHVCGEDRPVPSKSIVPDGPFKVGDIVEAVRARKGSEMGVGIHFMLDDEGIKVLGCVGPASVTYIGPSKNVTASLGLQCTKHSWKGFVTPDEVDKTSGESAR